MFENHATFILDDLVVFYNIENENDDDGDGDDHAVVVVDDVDDVGDDEKHRETVLPGVVENVLGSTTSVSQVLSLN